MPFLAIKNLPEDLHHRLKEQAFRHHRSMTREAVVILSEGLSQSGMGDTPALYKG